MADERTRDDTAQDGNGGEAQAEQATERILRSRRLPQQTGAARFS